jgi:hypothetical protein
MRREAGVDFGWGTVLLASLGYWTIAHLWSTWDWGFRSWTGIGLFLLSAVLSILISLAIKLVTSTERSIIQSLREDKARDLVKLVHVPGQANLPSRFFLYLRPFAATSKLYIQGPSTNSTHQNANELIDFEMLMPLALRPDKVIALGEPGEITGAARISAPEQTWQTLAKKLLEHASWIIILPSYHGGTFWEIEQIVRNGHLGKCIWLMPETITQGGFHCSVGLPSFIYFYDYQPIDHSAEWGLTSKKLKEIGLELPLYATSGMMFAIGPGNSIIDSEILSLSRTCFRVRKFRRTIMRLKNSLSASWQLPSDFPGSAIGTSMPNILVGGTGALICCGGLLLALYDMRAFFPHCFLAIGLLMTYFAFCRLKPI